MQNSSSYVHIHLILNIILTVLTTSNWTPWNLPILAYSNSILVHCFGMSKMHSHCPMAHILGYLNPPPPLLSLEVLRTSLSVLLVTYLVKTIRQNWAITSLCLPRSVNNSQRRWATCHLAHVAIYEHSSLQSCCVCKIKFLSQQHLLSPTSSFATLRESFQLSENWK